LRFALYERRFAEGPQGILIQQTKNVQAARQIRFASLADINKQKGAVKAY